MVRPRFQVGIGTAMLAVVVIGIDAALWIHSGYFWGELFLAPGSSVVAYVHVASLCRIEKRRLSEDDGAKILNFAAVCYFTPVIVRASIEAFS